MANTFTPVRVRNWQEIVPGGYKLHSGWALQDTAGRLLSFRAGVPWIPRGGKSAVDMVAAEPPAEYSSVAPQA